MTSQSWSVYYAKGKVLVPTRVKTTAGVGMEIDPMEVVGVDNAAELKRSILAVIAKGNPVVPHPSREEMSKPVTFQKKLGFRNYKAFNQTAVLWSLDLDHDVFEIIFTRVPEDGRGYDRDMSKTITFPSNTPVETVVDRLIEIIQETHKQKIAENTKR